MNQKFSTASLTKKRNPTRLSCTLTLNLALALVISSTAPALAQSTTPVQSNASTAYQTAQDYVTTFYPLWFTYYQSSNSTPNQLVGPDRVSPLYQTVVAINVDTLYASSFADLSTPAVLTIPESPVSFSVLVLDRYGDILTPEGDSNASPSFRFVAGHTYVLNGPGFSGLPSGVSTLR